MMKWVAILATALTLPAGAQWLNYPEAGTPRTKDGKANLTAAAPRMNGKPDLSGVWQAQRTPLSEYAKYLGNEPDKIQIDLSDVTKEAVDVFWGIKPDERPVRPEALAIVKQRVGKDGPTLHCLPSGVPANLFIYDFKIIQAPREIVMLPEGEPARQIYTDGRSLPTDPQPAWMGYSVAKWEGDTLAVETKGFTEASWLDVIGAHPRSEGMRIRERYHRRDFGHMDLEITMEDPKYYTRPIVLKTQLNLIPDSDVLEFVCNENEKDVAHSEKQ